MESVAEISAGKVSCRRDVFVQSLMDSNQEEFAVSFRNNCFGCEHAEFLDFSSFVGPLFTKHPLEKTSLGEAG